ncbi:MAG TPA: hypothetical protein VF257_04340 [Solirubrobacteraceae bacterium]
MTKPPPSSENLNANEADLAMRKAHREAAARAGDLADRLAEVDIHQREARYLLERAGLLRRRHARARSAS